MKFAVFFLHMLLCFSGQSNVECSIMESLFNNRLTNMIYSFFGSASDAEYPSLVLAVDKATNCFLANVPIITHRMGPNFNKYLFACPAETDAEVKINQHHSITKRALFIRDSYENPRNKEKDKKGKPQDMSEFDKMDSQFIEYTCESPILPSVKRLGTVFENGMEIEFHLVGFEVYMGGHEKLKVIDYGGKNLGLNKNFAWLNLLIVRFDPKGGNVLSVTCEMYNDRLTIRPPSTKPAVDLPDNLWKEYFYGEKNYVIDFTYTDGNQEQIFQKLYNPTPLLGPIFNPVQDRRLVKVHLVPRDSFVHPVLEQAARTYGNIAPMWEMIRRNSWFKVEEFVRHIVQGVFGVFVITGTYGTLSFGNNEHDVYLEANDNVKVPLAFWKIVMYTKKAQQFYNILIVTVNNPYENKSDLLCKKSQCQKYGWEYVEQSDISTGRTFCCEITTEILKELQLENNVKVDQVLNLKKVPHWEKDTLTLDVARFIQDQRTGSIDPVIRADNRKYRNENVMLDSELEKSKKSGNEEITLTGVATIVFTDYISPFVSRYLSNFSIKNNGNVDEKSKKSD